MDKVNKMFEDIATKDKLEQSLEDLDAAIRRVQNVERA